MGYLALDIGSSFIKYAILDIESQRIRAKRKLSVPAPVSDRETRYEIPAEKIWNIVESLTDEVLGREKHLDGILFCTQMQGFVLVDDKSEAVIPYISWQDNRCMERHGGRTWLQELEDMGCGQWMEHAGVRLRAGLSMCSLYVVLEEMQGTPEGLHFCTLGSYIIRKMTGNNVCHITNGAATGLADIVRKKWNRRLIEKIGAGGLHFPKLALEMESCGYYERNGHKIPVFPDMGDHQACVLGSLARPEQDVNINIGTAGLLGIVTNGYRQSDGEVRPYYGNRYLNTMRGLYGGRDLECIVGFIHDTVETVTGEKVRSGQVWDVISRAPAECSCKSLEVVPGFYQGGTIAGITQSNFTLNSLMNAVYKQMARQYRSALMTALPTGFNVGRVVYSGGAAIRNPRLMECIAREIGCEWQKAMMEDEALLGLYRMALLVDGSCSDLEETSVIAENIRVEEES